MEFNLYLGVSLLCFMFPILQLRLKYISLTTMRLLRSASTMGRAHT